MYDYVFVEAKAELFFTQETYSETIVEMGKKGYRFIQAIPFYQSQEGKIKSFKLVFEKEI